MLVEVSSIILPESHIQLGSPMNVMERPGWWCGVVLVMLMMVINYCMINYSSRLPHLWFLSTERSNFPVLSSCRCNILKIFWYHAITPHAIPGHLLIQHGSLNLVVRWPLKRYMKVYCYYSRISV
jgi:hypothetical protein